MKNWKNVLVVAVHPDDETLGCGGTLLKLKKEGASIHWLIVTTTENSRVLGEKFWESRKKEISDVAEIFQFDSLHQLPFEAGFLEEVPKHDLVSKINEVFRKVQPDTVFLPFPWDIHKEHQVTFEASLACTKVFRNPFVERIFIMETPSETDFAPAPLVNSFVPTHFVNIENFIDLKMHAMRIYKSEIFPHPFPRSEEAIRSIAKVRGAQSGFVSAEAFMCLKERYL